MPKQLVVIFSKLEAKRASKGHTTKILADILDMSEDSVRRRLRGEVEFELPEIYKLIIFYNCSFEELLERKKLEEWQWLQHRDFKMVSKLYKQQFIL